MKPKEISKSVLKRLPSYLTYLKSLPPDSPPNISATALAAALSMGEVQVRKDLALVSDGGRPKVGYMRQSLIADIEQFLGYDNTTEAVLIGAGKLGQALLGYSGFAEYGLEIVAAFDADETLDGKTESGKPIYAISKLPQFCQERKVLMGIITVPAAAAQQGVAVPAISASLNYFDGLCDPAGPLNLLQAQRDCFGAHTFRRIDREGVFHYAWLAST